MPWKPREPRLNLNTFKSMAGTHVNIVLKDETVIVNVRLAKVGGTKKAKTIIYFGKSKRGVVRLDKVARLDPIPLF